MALNDNVQWNDLEPLARAAFQTKFGMPTKDLLPKGTALYKFNNYMTLHATGNTALSPWWSPYNAYKQDAGWAQRLSIAAANGVSIREWGRVTSAVKENWNSLQYLLVITLGVEVFGWFGGFAQMVRVDPGETSLVKAGEGRGATKNLPGGATQFYIPNLTAAHVQSWSAKDLSAM